MKSREDVLRRIEALPAPRHLFVLPDWARPGTIDRLMDEGYITCGHHQRDQDGSLQVVMNLKLTAKAEHFLRPPKAAPGIGWSMLALKASLAGATMTLMSLLVLYLA